MDLIRRANAPLTGYRPGMIEDQFGRMVENMFEDFFAPLSAASPLSRISGEGIASPRLDVSETEKSFEVHADMPGVKKEDVKVSIDKQRVTIEGECKQETEQREGERVVCSERSARKFMRSFLLPTDVDDTTAQAHLENGVLTLSLPKKQGTEAKKLTIQ
ncbi:MAG: Hsp20/alpha crystallin family protein [Telluria sp.]|nr:Hsp20/alpha crystallin family protein [Telluria sp.]